MAAANVDKYQGAGYVVRSDNELAKLALRGLTIIIASGDAGAGLIVREGEVVFALLQPLTTWLTNACRSGTIPSRGPQLRRLSPRLAQHFTLRHGSRQHSYHTALGAGLPRATRPVATQLPHRAFGRSLALYGHRHALDCK